MLWVSLQLKMFACWSKSSWYLSWSYSVLSRNKHSGLISNMLAQITHVQINFFSVSSRAVTLQENTGIAQSSSSEHLRPNQHITLCKQHSQICPHPKPPLQWHDPSFLPADLSYLCWMKGGFCHHAAEGMCRYSHTCQLPVPSAASTNPGCTLHSGGIAVEWNCPEPPSVPG